MKTNPTFLLLFSFLAAVCGSELASGTSERTSVESNAATLVLSSWVNLLPKVVSCYMALAGIFSITTHCASHIPLSF